MNCGSDRGVVAPAISAAVSQMLMLSLAWPRGVSTPGRSGGKEQQIWGRKGKGQRVESGCGMLLLGQLELPGHLLDLCYGISVPCILRE